MWLSCQSCDKWIPCGIIYGKSMPKPSLTFSSIKSTLSFSWDKYAFSLVDLVKWRVCAFPLHFKINNLKKEFLIKTWFVKNDSDHRLNLFGIAAIISFWNNLEVYSNISGYFIRIYCVQWKLQSDFHFCVLDISHRKVDQHSLHRNGMIWIKLVE